MLVVKSGFHTRKIFIGKLPAIWARARKKVRQPCPKLRKFKEYRFDEAPHF